MLCKIIHITKYANCNVIFDYIDAFKELHEYE